MFLRLIIFSTRQRNLFHFNQSNNLLCLFQRCVCITKICTLQTSSKLLGLKKMKLYLLLSMLDLIAKFPTVVFHLISNWQGYFTRICQLLLFNRKATLPSFPFAKNTAFFSVCHPQDFLPLLQFQWNIALQKIQTLVIRILLSTRRRPMPNCELEN